MVGLADYLLGGMLAAVVLNGATLIYLLTISSRVGKQQRLIEFIHSRAQKAKKLEEHREKIEEQRLSKMKKTRMSTK